MGVEETEGAAAGAVGGGAAAVGAGGTAPTAAVGVLGMVMMGAAASMAVGVVLATVEEVETPPMAEPGGVAITVAPAPLGGPVAVETAAAAAVLAM